MRKTAEEKLKLGLFVITGLAIFIIGIYFVGERQNLFGKSVLISVEFPNINGLRKGNNVRYAGINVGTVEEITLINDSVIKVDLLIEKKMVTQIKKNAIATLGTDGLVGNMIVSIVPGKGEAPTVNPGDYIKSFSKTSTDEMLKTLSTTNENAALLTIDLLKITKAINSEKGTVGLLIHDSITAKNLKQTIANLQQTSDRANKTMETLQTKIAAINLDNSVAGVLLNDTLQANKMRKIIANLETSSNTINATMDTLNKTMTQIKNGKGAVNYLTTDETFVKNLDQTIKNLKDGTDKFNESMEALQHNFLLRGFFRKKEKAKQNN